MRKYWIPAVILLLVASTSFAVRHTTTGGGGGGTGDIEGVTAGSGLTDGGTTGTVTLNVGAGTGITVAADSVATTLGISIEATEMGDADHGQVSWSNGVATVDAVSDGAIPSGITRDTEWDTAGEINAATTDSDFTLAGHTHEITSIDAFTSAQLATQTTDETGTGGAVFANSPTFVDDMTLGGAGAGSIFLSDGSSNTTKFTTQAQAGDIVLTLPADDGGAGTYLKSDGSGNLSWDSPAGAGDIEGVTAGTGMSGGGTSGTVTLNSLLGTSIESTELGDNQDFGDASTGATGVLTLDADVVAAAEMADADHGEVTWASGVATIDTESIALSELSDVTITAAATNEIMAYNGSAWVDVSTFTGNVTGNVTGDVTGNVSGSSGSCTGNAATATTAAALAVLNTGITPVDAGDGYLSFTEDGTEHMRFTGGELGIGTTTPAALTKLNVKQTAVDDGTTGMLVENTAVSAEAGVDKYGLVVSVSGSLGGSGSIARGLSVTVADAATNYAAIFSGGNVGIGSTAPATALDVTGTVNGTALTEGGNAVYNATETPGGSLGGTWASPTIDDLFLLNTGDTGTGGYDLGGATVELPNGTAPNIDGVGEVAVDSNSDNSNITHGTLFFHDGSGPRYIPSVAAYPSNDGYALCYDSGTKAFVFEAVATASGLLDLKPQEALVQGAMVLDGDVSAGATISSADGGWALLFDQTTDEGAVWQCEMPANYAAQTVYADILYSMASGVTLEVEFEVEVMAVTPGDAADCITPSFDTVNVGSDSVPTGGAGYLDKVTITLTNKDSVAAGDLVFFKLSTDSDDATNDDATGDREVRAVHIRW